MAESENTAESPVIVRESASETTLYLKGSWRMAYLPMLAQALDRLPQINKAKKIVLDASELRELDTAGVMLVYNFLQRPENFPGKDRIEIRSAKPELLQLAQLVRERLAVPASLENPMRLNLLEQIGAATCEILAKIKDLLSFIGESVYDTLGTIRHPRRLRLKELFVQLELACLDAIPIVCLVMFLIGVVIAYLFGMQIEKYGANIFIVDGVTLAICRELSPVIVAIIVAGRSGSAFTAQLGAMKINEETDAMVTLGLSPMRVLVLPRLYALAIALPLLVFVGDIIGIVGAALVADLRLGITGYTFVDRLRAVLPALSFGVGLIKAPVFAAFIAVIGCRMGLAVENNARSLGLSTTSTVVQSIVSVILLNALFAIIFQQLGI